MQLYHSISGLQFVEVQDDILVTHVLKWALHVLLNLGIRVVEEGFQGVQLLPLLRLTKLFTLARQPNPALLHFSLSLLALPVFHSLSIIDTAPLL